MYTYRCKIVRVVDGDTVDINIDLGFGVWLHNERIRIVGIDTPECRTRDLIEKQFGFAAKEYAKILLPVDSEQILLSKKFAGKFGRILGDFAIDETSFAEMMLENHYAAPYFGNSKEEIEEIHLTNRTKLIEAGVVILEEKK
jgi:micrococcal nuclease